MEQKTALEKLSVALNSGNLKLKETRCDLDYVIAMGMVCAGNPVASSIISVHLGGNKTSYKEARRATIELTKKLNNKREWKLEIKDVLRVADSALKMYLSPVCPKCFGRKYQVADGTPTLSSRPCPKCNGSGLRRYPQKDGRRISEVVNALSSIEDVAEAAIRKKMRNG